MLCVAQRLHVGGEVVQLGRPAATPQGLIKGVIVVGGRAAGKKRQIRSSHPIPGQRGVHGSDSALRSADGT